MRSAYSELEERLNILDFNDSKGALIKKVILAQNREFCLGDIQRLCPTVRFQMIKKTLSDLKIAGHLSLTGKGRGAKWRVCI